MKSFFAIIFLLTMTSTTQAQTVTSHGIPLAPGETLVSINGVAVQGGTTTTAASPTTQRSTSSSAAMQMSTSLAQSKANQMARTNTLRHLGGGFGGGRYEGVGVGSTRDAAIRNCCYWGQRTPIDIGAAFSGSRWYACVIYR